MPSMAASNWRDGTTEKMLQIDHRRHQSLERDAARKILQPALGRLRAEVLTTLPATAQPPS